MEDCLIVGAGAVGLSLAYVLAAQRVKVRVLDADEPGQKSSWAGAGIIAPCLPLSSEPIDKLVTLSNQLHLEWARELRESTGIDNGYLASGGIYMAREPKLLAALESDAARWRQGGAKVIEADREMLAEIEPALRPAPPALKTFVCPEEAQLRNPRHLQALVAACRARGVKIEPHEPAVDFEHTANRVTAVITPGKRFAADRFCLTAGSWSGLVAQRLGYAPGIKPIRGQIVLVSCPRPPIRHVIYEGKRYLVPRDDGRVLIGSTEEDVGFDSDPTPEACDDLYAFARSLAPELGDAKIQRTWAGLRPASIDDLPFMGRIPGWDNAFISAGHFRHGLQLSPGSAIVLARLLAGEAAPFDISPFDPARPSGQAGAEQQRH